MSKTLTELSVIVATLMGTKVTEVSEEQQEADAGFELANNHTLQYSPYMENPYSFAYFDEIKASSIPIKSFKNADELISYLSDKDEITRDEKIEVLVDKEIDSIENDLACEDRSVLTAILKGDNWVQFNNMTDEQINTEYNDYISEKAGE